MGRTRKPPYSDRGTGLPAPPSSLIYASLVPGKGWGVFAASDIAKGTVVEVCPITLVESVHTGNNILVDYEFYWDDDRSAIVWGLGSIYNHSADPNLIYWLHEDPPRAVFVAIRDVPSGAELVHDYKWDEYPWEKPGGTSGRGYARRF
jgi:uncharacterized protein